MELRIGEDGVMREHKPEDFVEVDKKGWDLLMGFIEEYDEEWKDFVEKNKDEVVDSE